MKKIFLIAVVLLMMINFIINYHHEVTKEKHTPMADFKTKVEMAPMKEYNDPDFGYVVKYPCFFQHRRIFVSGPKSSRAKVRSTCFKSVNDTFLSM